MFSLIPFYVACRLSYVEITVYAAAAEGATLSHLLNGEVTCIRVVYAQGLDNHKEGFK